MTMMTERLTVYERPHDPDEFDCLEIFRGSEVVADMAPDGKVTDECRRLARLFAASEYMFEALKFARPFMAVANLDSSQDLISPIDDAISKAKGET